MMPAVAAVAAVATMAAVAAVATMAAVAAVATMAAVATVATTVAAATAAVVEQTSRHVTAAGQSHHQHNTVHRTTPPVLKGKRIDLGYA
jgi:hypothetical protein